MRDKGIFNIIFKSIKLYLKNIIPFGRIMLFPILGQILGLLWILGDCYLLLTLLYSQVPQEILFKNMPLIILGMLVVLIPGFLLFTKAFWAYLISIISTILVSEDLIKGSKIKKVKDYKASVLNRGQEYILLLLVVSLLWVVGLFGPAILFGFLTLLGMPVALVAFAIVFFTFISVIALLMASISICLVNQVFAFEKHSPIGYLKKSWQLIDKKVPMVLGFILLFSIALTLLSFVFTLPFNIFGVSSFFEKIFNDGVLFYMKSVISFFVIDQNTSSQILLKSPKVFADILIMFIVSALVLPFGSISFTLLYQLLTVKTSGKKKKS